MSFDLTPSTTEAISSLVAAINNAQAQNGDHLDIRAIKRRETITPANAFSLCFHGSLAQIMDKTNLSRPALRLLFELIDISALGNLISINQNGLAARIGVSPNSISRSMRALVEAGVVLELPHGLFLNPQLISKQGLATVAKSYPKEVAAGIAALQAQGIAPNWTPTTTKPNTPSATERTPTTRTQPTGQQAEQARQHTIATILGA
jgi:Winged helix-turn-helix DNA-binding